MAKIVFQSRFAASLAIILVFFTVPPGKTHGNEQWIGTLTAVSGTVTVRRPGDEGVRQAVRGDEIAVADVVSTGPEGRAQVRLSDDSLVTLGPRSSLRVNQFSFDAKRNRRTAVVRVMEGAARVTVYKVRSPESDMTIESATASVAVDNLVDCVVTVAPEGTVVAVLEQAVRVRNLLPYVIGEVRLSENQKSTVAAKKPPSAPATVSADERRTHMKDFMTR